MQGTGKSVLAMNLLKLFTSKRLNASYVTKNSAPREAYLKLIQYLNVNQKAKIILTSSFWKREGDDIIEDVAKENGWD